MRCDEVLGHGPLLAGLWRAAAAGRLAHALGFFGAAGVGKFLAAERCVRGLLCARGPAEPCDACGPCKRALADAHADVLVLDAQAAGENELPIAWITPREGSDKAPPDGRTIEEFLSLRPMEGGWRAVLVRDAERLSEAAQNALLKMLEEPGERALLILVTSAPADLLPTIRSRLVGLQFGPLAPADVAAAFARAEVPAAERGELVRWSRGAPGRGLELRAQNAADVLALVARVLSGDLDAHAGAAAIAALDGRFPGKTPAARARSQARAALDLVLAVLLDARRARAGADPGLLAHGDLARAIAAPDAALDAALERALSARQDVDHNLDPALALERALQSLPKARAARDHETVGPTR